MAATKRMAIKIAQYGVLTRTVRDTANFYAAVEATAPSKTLPPIGKVAGPSSDKQRIGVFIDVPITSEIHPEIRQATEHAAKRLESMGHAVEWISPPADQGLADDFLLYWAFNAGLLELIVRLSPTARVGRLEPWTRGLAAHARSNMRHIRGAIGRLRAFEETYAALFNDLDVVLSPTTAGPAPKLGVISPDIDFEEGIQRLTQLLPYTPVQNVAGAPAINMPAGKTQDGLPIGVQLCAAQGQERKLLELAFALES